MLTLLFVVLLAFSASAQVQGPTPALEAGIGRPPTPRPSQFDYPAAEGATSPAPANNKVPLPDVQTERPNVLGPLFTWDPLNLSGAISWNSSCVEVYRELLTTPIYQYRSTYVFTPTTFSEEIRYTVDPKTGRQCDPVDFIVRAVGYWNMSSYLPPATVQRITFRYTDAVAIIYSTAGTQFLNVECASNFVPPPRKRNVEQTTNTTTTAPTTTAPTNASNAVPVLNRYLAPDVPINASYPPFLLDLNRLNCNRLPGSTSCRRLEQLIQGNPLGDAFILGARDVSRTCALVPTTMSNLQWTGQYPEPTIPPESALSGTASFSFSTLLVMVTVSITFLFL